MRQVCRTSLGGGQKGSAEPPTLFALSLIILGVLVLRFFEPLKLQIYAVPWWQVVTAIAWLKTSVGLALISIGLSLLARILGRLSSRAEVGAGEFTGNKAPSLVTQLFAVLLAFAGLVVAFPLAFTTWVLFVYVAPSSSELMVLSSMVMIVVTGFCALVPLRTIVSIVVRSRIRDAD
ncbi:MAG: hypothetical protein EBZ48_00630, partial [Proteobacteria bacterium]|nr:hypothetical protein [Pseudomonadota bacterium]